MTEKKIMLVIKNLKTKKIICSNPQYSVKNYEPTLIFFLLIMDPTFIV